VCTRQQIGNRAFFVAAPRAWNRLPTKLKCCDRQTCFVVIWKHFGFIPSMGTKIRIDSVMCPRFSSRGRNTSASVTVTVTSLIWLYGHVTALYKLSFDYYFICNQQCSHVQGFTKFTHPRRFSMTTLTALQWCVTVTLQSTSKITRLNSPVRYNTMQRSVSMSMSSHFPSMVK